jgi:hypothetical protein
MRFTGTFPEAYESATTEMLTAMREGLTANGFDVKATINFTAKVEL